MNNLSALRKRVKDLESNFGRFDSEEQDRRSRLNEALDSIQSAFRSKQAELEEAKDELGRLGFENDELKDLLSSLLKSIETSSRADIRGELKAIEGKIQSLSSMVEGGVQISEMPAGDYFAKRDAAAGEDVAPVAGYESAESAVAAPPEDEAAKMTPSAEASAYYGSDEEDEIPGAAMAPVVSLASDATAGPEKKSAAASGSEGSLDAILARAQGRARAG